VHALTGPDTFASRSRLRVTTGRKEGKRGFDGEGTAEKT